MTTEQKLIDIQKTYAENPVAMARAIERLTNELYELPTLRASNERKRRSTRDISAQSSDAGAQAQADVDEAHDIADATGGMVAVGGNVAWLQAIELSRINATPDGVERTLKVRDARRVQSSRGNMQARRREQAGAVQARKEERRKVQAKKPKYARRAVAVPPSQR